MERILTEIQPYPAGVQITGEMNERYQEILTPDALSFLADLSRTFEVRRQELLLKREKRQQEFDQGMMPHFLEETKDIREADWTIAPIPADLQDRRVEITGPTSDRKMVINACNSGAKAFMADFEDANSPSWRNTIEGQINMRDVINRTISFTSKEGKSYQLHEQITTLLVRPRGWHLQEKHIYVDGHPMSASFVDFGLYFYHNAKKLLEIGSGPYFYLPKIEGHEEARLWNDVFVFAQQRLGIEQGTIKATVLIETILASFEMDEILYELRDHSAGLNCGRWDYIFSFIKKFRKNKRIIFPDRAQVTMAVPFMKAYCDLTIQTCHKRNAHAMGGMAAQIPVRNDVLANEAAFEKVRLDKEREALAGHDGTWVAHPGLVPVAMSVFDQIMPSANQLHLKRTDVQVCPADLLAVPEGTITEQGLRTNISVAIQYVEAWLRGMGAVPINNLMEDAATAEISRAQVWQWIRHPDGIVTDGRKITWEWVEELIHEEIATLQQEIGSERFEAGEFSRAIALFKEVVQAEKFMPFITIPAYEHI
ncbi:malate synthase A [Brevibacillus laterosporus]|uniref:malate synthase A n=1 Tax=Brevibacillus laterosporus TaxID=1465 RepID=UPI00038106BB|nr:malate synthase A [Brevibacillus laterosporus]ATO49435.1 malate synthase A [Brevibacillus laterosporus DSM 25]MBG9802118.1 malate synthase [Brevibacillus laterosporus]MED2002094.1 malate synthase A [Brevibacillus laterosporus]MED4764735.1 malate synthase A [Brevibacillus laterosporus]TPH22038.1 malate synthase A [Brevibacillus laterosporus]